MAGALLWGGTKEDWLQRAWPLYTSTDVYITGMRLCLCALKWPEEFILPKNDRNAMGPTLDFILEAGEEMAPKRMDLKGSWERKMKFLHGYTFCFLCVQLTKLFYYVSMYVSMYLWRLCVRTYMHTPRIHTYTHVYIYWYIYIYMAHM